MKKWLKKNKMIGLILLIIFTIVLLLILMVLFSSKKEKKVPTNQYSFSKEVKELTGTKEYETEALKSKHCLDGICISEAKFYYLDNQGRVEYVIENVSSEVKSGLYKMVFGGDHLVVSFTNVKPGDSYKTVSQYLGQTISYMDDYSLEYLSEDELKTVNVSN